jgi:hypothetical protein
MNTLPMPAQEVNNARTRLKGIILSIGTLANMRDSYPERPRSGALV